MPWCSVSADIEVAVIWRGIVMRLKDANKVQLGTISADLPNDGSAVLLALEIAKKTNLKVKILNSDGETVSIVSPFERFH